MTTRVLVAGIALLFALPLQAQERPRGPAGGRDPREMMKRADTNGDGKVSKAEFVAARSAEMEEAFTRIDANTMLVSMDKNVLKITFAGTEKKMLTAVVEDVTVGKVVMTVSAMGNWEIADASRFGRSLPALIAALSPQIGTACDPSYEQTRQAAKETCAAIIKTTYTCVPHNVSTGFNCGS